jgi:hypothetical protein
MHHVLPPEKYFPWRAGEITRLEAFCDVVFGFAITLLVVSLEVPRSFEELIQIMRGFLPFAACFAQFVLIGLRITASPAVMGWRTPTPYFSMSCCCFSFCSMCIH